jgi:hypothetical protein
MLQVELPDALTVRFRAKNGKSPSVPEYTVYPGKFSQAALAACAEQGIRSFLKNGTSHDSESDPKEIYDKVAERFYAPEWKARQRADAAEDELSLEDRAWIMALEPKFETAGVIVKRANAKRGLVKKTVLDVVDELGGDAENAYEVAARKVGEDYLRSQNCDPSLIPEKLDRSWKQITDAYKQALKMLQNQANAGW